MIPLRKETGGCVVAGYTWEHDGDVVEVADDVAMNLLSIRGGGFSVAQSGDDPAASAGHGHDEAQGDAGSGGGPSDPAPEEASGDEASSDGEATGVADPAGDGDAAEPEGDA